MTTTETRRAGYSAVQISAGAQAKRLLRLLIDHPEGLTFNELSRRSGFRINSVCGRMNELRRVELPSGEMLVENVGVVKDARTGVQNIVWQVNKAFRGVVDDGGTVKEPVRNPGDGTRTRDD